MVAIRTDWKEILTTDEEIVGIITYRDTIVVATSKRVFGLIDSPDGQLFQEIQVERSE
jgi:hypothetical protein